MKKMVSTLLIAVLSVSLVACGNNNADNDANNNANNNTNGVVAETQTPETQVPETQVPETTENNAAVNGESLGTILAADFVTQVTANENATALEIAEAVLTNEKIAFAGATMEVEPGLLNGFGNAEITGFSEGAMFGPMIGTIPFIGYIFTLEDGTDVEAFKDNLKTNGDLRWNICTEADEMVVESAGNKVFFVMCPSSLQEDM
ncbi:MAG: hypothetical protein ACI4F0_00535 [Agathobacter sp.]